MMTQPKFMAYAALLILLVTQMACGDDLPEPQVQVDMNAQPIEWMRLKAPLFEEDRTFRRNTLERMLWRPNLEYAIKLLEGYGLEDEGWDLLPEHDFEVLPVRQDTDWSVFEPGERLLPLKRPETREEWLALGREVFWKMPMRRDAYVEWAVRQPEVIQEAGMSFDEKGELPGFVRFKTYDGKERVGMTCGTCHGAGGVDGKADKLVDLGIARARFRNASGIPEGPFASWGPGKIDTTDDDVSDPVAIPNLWGLTKQSYFNSSGVIEVVSPATAAVRFETQYIVNHGFEVRPPRMLIWALAMYVMSLEPPEGVKEAPKEGEALFGQHCASCHNPEQNFAGGLIAASVLSTDPLAAQSRLRGTGSYRVPKLRGLRFGGPFMHDHSAKDLPEVIDSGHPFGQQYSLSDGERQALIDYLKTL